MAKTTKPAAAPAQKASYAVADGVDWINGFRITKTRTVHLTPAEALYDLSIGRITPVKANSRPAASSSAKTDGGD